MIYRINNPKSTQTGFSLLEVILAFAILAGALVVLGQLVRFGFRNARQAQGLTEAQMLCQTIMDEVVVGVMPVDPVVQAPISTEMMVFGTPTDANATWVYSVNWEPSSIEGLIAVQVVVERANVTSLSDNDRFQMIRWMPDPMLEVEEMPETSDPNSSTAEGGSS